MYQWLMTEASVNGERKEKKPLEQGENDALVNSEEEEKKKRKGK